MRGTNVSFLFKTQLPPSVPFLLCRHTVLLLDDLYLPLAPSSQRTWCYSPRSPFLYLITFLPSNLLVEITTGPSSSLSFSPFFFARWCRRPRSAQRKDFSFTFFFLLQTKRTGLDLFFPFWRKISLPCSAEQNIRRRFFFWWMFCYQRPFRDWLVFSVCASIHSSSSWKRKIYSYRNTVQRAKASFFLFHVAQQGECLLSLRFWPSLLSL